MSNINSKLDRDWFLSMLRLNQVSTFTLSKAMGISSTELSNVLQGKRQFKFNEAEILSEQFHTPIEEVLKRIGLNSVKKMASTTERTKRIVDRVRVIRSSGQSRPTVHTAEPVALFNRNEVIQIFMQMGASLEYPQGLLKGTSLRIPVEQLEIIASSIATLQFEEDMRVLLRNSKKNPELPVASLIESYRNELTKRSRLTTTVECETDDD